MKDTIKRLNEELSTRELEVILQDINSYNGGFETVVAYDKEWYFRELLQGFSPNEIANMVYFGSYNPSHEYFRFNGYGNIETLSEKDYFEEIEDYREEIIEEMLDLHERGHINFSEYF